MIIGTTASRSRKIDRAGDLQYESPGRLEHGTVRPYGTVDFCHSFNEPDHSNLTTMRDAA